MNDDQSVNSSSNDVPLTSNYFHSCFSSPSNPPATSSSASSLPLAKDGGDGDPRKAGGGEANDETRGMKSGMNKLSTEREKAI